MIKTLWISFLFLLIVASCKKERPYSLQDELSKLPAATQSGERKMGFLLEGKAWLPKIISPFEVKLAARYEKIYLNAFTFTMLSSRSITACEGEGFQIQGDSINIVEGQEYDFKAPGKGNFTAYLQSWSNCIGISYTTYTPSSGKILITRFSPSAHISSGTFWCNLVNNTGDTLKIREGRFDLLL